jgi:hypothetical protein
VWGGGAARLREPVLSQTDTNVCLSEKEPVLSAQFTTSLWTYNSIHPLLVNMNIVAAGANGRNGGNAANGAVLAAAETETGEVAIKGLQITILKASGSLRSWRGKHGSMRH